MPTIEGIPEAELNDVMFFSLLGGASALTPVPGAIRMAAVKHVMAGSQMHHAGLAQDLVSKPGESVRNLGALSRGAPMSPLAVAKTIAYYGCCCCALEQLFKKCCFMFTVKEMVEDCTQLLHEGWLLAYALQNKYITQDVLNNKDEIWRVREAILKASDAIDTSPISKALTTVFNTVQSKEAMREAANTVMQSMKMSGGVAKESSFQDAVEATESEGRQELSGLMKQLAEILKKNASYLRKFEQLFTDQLQGLQEAQTKPSASLLPF